MRQHGSLVDDDALIHALRSGKIAPAGLDVYNGEPQIRPEYIAIPNVFLLPHMGTATIETRQAWVCARSIIWTRRWPAKHRKIADRVHGRLTLAESTTEIRSGRRFSDASIPLFSNHQKAFDIHGKQMETERHST